MLWSLKSLWLEGESCPACYIICTECPCFSYSYSLAVWHQFIQNNLKRTFTPWMYLTSLHPPQPHLKWHIFFFACLPATQPRLGNNGISSALKPHIAFTEFVESRPDMLHQGGGLPKPGRRTQHLMTSATKMAAWDKACGNSGSYQVNAGSTEYVNCG